MTHRISKVLLSQPLIYGTQNSEILLSLSPLNLCRQDHNVISWKNFLRISWTLFSPSWVKLVIFQLDLYWWSVSGCTHIQRTWILADSIVISWLSFLTYCIVVWLIYVALYWLVVYHSDFFCWACRSNSRVDLRQYVHHTQCITLCPEVYTSTFLDIFIGHLPVNTADEICQALFVVQIN